MASSGRNDARQCNLASCSSGKLLLNSNCSIKEDDFVLRNVKENDLVLESVAEVYVILVVTRKVNVPLLSRGSWTLPLGVWKRGGCRR